jgi:hypothetical protein
MGVVGLSNLYYINNKTRLKTNLSFSGTRATTALDSLKGKDKIKSQFYRSSNQETILSFSTQLIHKFNAKNMMVTGIILDRYHVKFIDSVYLNDSQSYYRNTDVDGNTGLYQAYGQWKHKFNDKLLFNAGLHFQYFSLNGSTALEPRAGLEWKLGKGKSLSLGYGLHSQTQPRLIYFVRTELTDGTVKETNKDLGHDLIGLFYFANEIEVHHDSKPIRFRVFTP